MTELVADIYVRVSTEDQAKNGVSKDDQIARGKAAVMNRADLKLGKIIVDECSSKTPLYKRRGGSLLQERLASGKTKMVVVTKMDRAFRTTTEIIETVTRWGDEGISFTCLDQGFPIDTSNSMGRFLLTIFAGMAQFERDQIAERTKAGLDHIKEKLANGEEHVSKRSGRIVTRLGNPNSKGDTQSMKEARFRRTTVTDEFAVEKLPIFMEVIRDLHLRGTKATYDNVCHELNKRGQRTRQGYAWNPASWMRMWQRICGGRMELATDRYRTDPEWCLAQPALADVK